MKLADWLEAHKDASCEKCSHLRKGQCDVQRFVFVEDKTPKSIFCAMFERRQAA